MYNIVFEWGMYHGEIHGFHIGAVDEKNNKKKIIIRDIFLVVSS